LPHAGPGWPPNIPTKAPKSLTSTTPFNDNSNSQFVGGISVPKTATNRPKSLVSQAPLALAEKSQSQTLP
jgi:hypothetical protein